MAGTGSSRELPEVPSPKSSETLVPQHPDRSIEELNDDVLGRSCHADDFVAKCHRLRHRCIGIGGSAPKEGVDA